MPWPLGPVMMSGYGIGEEPNLLRTEMEQGPDRVVQVSSQYRSVIRAMVSIDSITELETYRNFYEGEAARGAAFFDMDIITKRTQATHSVRILDSQIQSFTDELFDLTLTLETYEHIS